MKTGVIQQLTHFNAASILSHIRRVCTPLDRVGRGSKPRNLHPSQYGFLCPVETPEGRTCGLIKAFALAARVTMKPSLSDYAAFRLRVIEACRRGCGGEGDPTGGHYVFLNGELLAEVDDPHATADIVRHAPAIGGRRPYFDASIAVSPGGEHLWPRRYRTWPKGTGAAAHPHRRRAGGASPPDRPPVDVRRPTAVGRGGAGRRGRRSHRAGGAPLRGRGRGVRGRGGPVPAGRAAARHAYLVGDPRAPDARGERRPHSVPPV